MKQGEGTKANIKLHVEIFGRGKPLIFLPGAMFEIGAYSKLFQILEKKYKVYAFDLPLHGKSTSEYLDFFQTADYLHEFCKANKIKSPTFCAHSAGCCIAMIYASKYKTEKLVMLDPAGLRYFNSIIALNIRQIVVLPFVTSYYYGLGTFKVIGQGLRFLARNIGRSGVIAFMDSCARVTLIREMRKIKCATTIVWAKEDEILDYNRNREFLANIKNSSIITLHGSHNWPLFKPEILEKII